MSYVHKMVYITIQLCGGSRPTLTDGVVESTVTNSEVEKSASVYCSCVVCLRLKGNNLFHQFLDDVLRHTKLVAFEWTLHIWKLYLTVSVWYTAGIILCSESKKKRFDKKN